jgi:hypothetical protein
MSDISSTLKDKKRFILQNPDGTFMTCVRTGERDSAIENKDVIRQNIEDNLTISDDDLQFIIENHDQYDYNVVMRHFLDAFRIYRFMYLIFFTSEMFITSFLMFNTWQKRESTIILVY